MTDAALSGMNKGKRIYHFQTTHHIPRFLLGVSYQPVKTARGLGEAPSACEKKGQGRPGKLEQFQNHQRGPGFHSRS